MKRVAFEALIKQIKVKSLVSGDKSGEIILWFRPTDDLLDGLNRLHYADEEVTVAIVKNIEQHAISKREQGKAEGGEV